MKQIKLKRHGIKKEGSVLLTSHTPINLLGKYGDFYDGSISGFNANELYFKSIANRYKEDYVKIYFPKSTYTFYLKKFGYNEVSDKGTIKGLLYGTFKELIDQKLLVNFEGIKFSYITTIKESEGFYTNFLINFIKSLVLIYDIKMEDSQICEVIQKVYYEYGGKILPYLYLMSFFIDGAYSLSLKGNKLTIGNSFLNLDRFAIFDLRIKDALTTNESNIYLKSIYDVYKKVRDYARVNKLTDINFRYAFNYLFGPYSQLKDYEKLVITYFFEEEKRCFHFLEAFNDEHASTKLLDSINQSNVEAGAYLNLNAYNNHLEANVYKATFKHSLALTEANIEATNNFIYITTKELKEEVTKHLLQNKNNDLHELTISPKGIEISSLEDEKNN